MKVDGACHCGEITYQADVDPANVRVCNCTDCQTMAGSAFRISVATPEENFTLLTGTPKHYIKTAESGSQRVQSFCETCGTPIYATSVGEGHKTYGLRVGCIAQRQQLKPQSQIWTSSAMEWLDDVPSLPGSDRQ